MSLRSNHDRREFVHYFLSHITTLNGFVRIDIGWYAVRTGSGSRSPPSSFRFIRFIVTTPFSSCLKNQHDNYLGYEWIVCRNAGCPSSLFISIKLSGLDSLRRPAAPRRSPAAPLHPFIGLLKLNNWHKLHVIYLLSFIF